MLCTWWRRRAIVEVAEPVRLPLDVGQVHLRSLRQEVCGHEEDLLPGLAAELIHVGPEQDDRVGLSLDVEGVDQLGEGGGLGTVLRVQGEVGSPRATEVHGPQERSSPCMQEVSKSLVISLREGVLWGCIKFS